MELDSFKEAIGIDDIDEFDNQIQTVLDLTSDEPTSMLHLLRAMCLLEGLNPELCSRVESWTIGGATEKYKLGEGSSACELYKQERAKIVGGFGASSGARSGQSSS